MEARLPDLSPESRFAVAVVSLAALAMWFGSYHIQRTPPLLYGAWALGAFLAVPLAGAVALDARRGAVRALALAAGLVALAPLGWRAWGAQSRELFAAQPLLIVVPATVALVLAVVAAGLDEVDLGEWGAGAGDWRWWGPRTAMVALLTLGFVVAWVALDPGMRAHHPFYEPARTDAAELWGLVLCLLLYMVAWEWFFRGFLLFGVARTAGPVHAVLFQAVPFYLLHRGSPESEFVLSFVGAVLLAAFCYRARSFWPAFLLHWVLNASMQITCFYWPG